MEEERLFLTREEKKGNWKNKDGVKDEDVPVFRAAEPSALKADKTKPERKRDARIVTGFSLRQIPGKKLAQIPAE